MCLGKYNASKELVMGGGGVELYMYAFLILPLCEGEWSFTPCPLNPWEINTSTQRIYFFIDTFIIPPVDYRLSVHFLKYSTLLVFGL
jgi:hypothetical protein